MKICHDVASQELVFHTEIPDDSWLGIGFGPTMTNTDMLVWESRSGKGIIRDVFSVNHSTPGRDTTENLRLVGNSKFDSKNRTVLTESRRKLDTGDEGDYLV